MGRCKQSIGSSGQCNKQPMKSPRIGIVLPSLKIYTNRCQNDLSSVATLYSALNKVNYGILTVRHANSILNFSRQ